MKKLVLLASVLLSFSASAAYAAPWNDQIESAVKAGKFDQIDVIAAKNPEDQGDIALYLLQQSQNASLSQETRVKLFEAAAPFGSQIPTENSVQAAGLISNMLALSGDPSFEKDHHKEAVGVIAAALGMSDQPNILVGNEGVHEQALAQANEYAGSDDKGLQDEVDLALQIGLSPPIGPRGIINPSRE